MAVTHPPAWEVYCMYSAPSVHCMYIHGTGAGTKSTSMASPAGGILLGPGPVRPLCLRWRQAWTHVGGLATLFDGHPDGGPDGNGAVPWPGAPILRLPVRCHGACLADATRMVQHARALRRQRFFDACTVRTHGEACRSEPGLLFLVSFPLIRVLPRWTTESWGGMLNGRQAEKSLGDRGMMAVRILFFCFLVSVFLDRPAAWGARRPKKRFLVQ